MSGISVIIPAYNREAYVGGAIESVLAQTLLPDEILVVDDGSTDRTGEIARSYGGIVRCISQENQGCGGARNTGVRAARGSFFAFLDSDDLFLPRKLEVQAACLRENPSVAMAFCRMKPFLSPELDPTARAIDTRELDAINGGALLVRREACDAIGPFPLPRNEPEFFGWFSRATDLGLTHRIVPELLLLRRVHLSNTVDDASYKLSYTRFLKQRLDQKRRANPPPPSAQP